MSYQDCYKPENETPRRAMQEAFDAIKAVHKAFGAPGNYGYGHPQGEALRWLYDSTRLLAVALKSLEAEGREVSS